jgi:hypothetical protein
VEECWTGKQSRLGLADEVEKVERGPVVYTESTKRILVLGETTGARVL